MRSSELLLLANLTGLPASSEGQIYLTCWVDHRPLEDTAWVNLASIPFTIDGFQLNGLQATTGMCKGGGKWVKKPNSSLSLAHTAACS